MNLRARLRRLKALSERPRKQIPTDCYEFAVALIAGQFKLEDLDRRNLDHTSNVAELYSALVARIAQEEVKP